MNTTARLSLTCRIKIDSNRGWSKSVDFGSSKLSSTDFVFEEDRKLIECPISSLWETEIAPDSAQGTYSCPEKTWN